MPRKHLIIFVITLVLVSHVILPSLNRGQDFFLFSTWRLFSGSQSLQAIDLTWDSGNSYLFRDHRTLAKNAKIDLIALAYHLNQGNIEVIQNKFVPRLKDLCHCQEISIHKINLSLYDHIVRKQKGDPEMVKTL